METNTYPGSFGTSSVPGGNEVIIDAVDPMAGLVAGDSMMIICKIWFIITALHKKVYFSYNCNFNYTSTAN